MNKLKVYLALFDRWHDDGSPRGVRVGKLLDRLWTKLTVAEQQMATRVAAKKLLSLLAARCSLLAARRERPLRALAWHAERKSLRSVGG